MSSASLLITFIGAPWEIYEYNSASSQSHPESWIMAACKIAFSISSLFPSCHKRNIASYWRGLDAWCCTHSKTIHRYHQSIHPPPPDIKICYGFCHQPHSFKWESRVWRPWYYLWLVFHCVQHQAKVPSNMKHSGMDACKMVAIVWHSITWTHSTHWTLDTLSTLLKVYSLSMAQQQNKFEILTYECIFIVHPTKCHGANLRL